jgi:hypothetical protein
MDRIPVDGMPAELHHRLFHPVMLPEPGRSGLRSAVIMASIVPGLARLLT